MSYELDVSFDDDVLVVRAVGDIDDHAARHAADFAAAAARAGVPHVRVRLHDGLTGERWWVDSER